MLVDVGHHRIHHLVGGAVGVFLGAAVGGGLVQLHQQFHQAAGGQQVVAVAVPGVQFAQPFQPAAHLGAGRPGQPQQVGVAGDAGVKAAGQAGARAGVPLQVAAGHPQHDPLVGFAVGGDAGLVQFQRADQHQVAGAHLVQMVFHNIAHLAAQQQVDLVKIVMVQCHLVHIGAAVAVDLEVAGDHRLAAGVGLKRGGHGPSPFRRAPQPPPIHACILTQFLQSFKQFLQFDLQKERRILGDRSTADPPPAGPQA